MHVCTGQLLSLFLTLSMKCLDDNERPSKIHIRNYMHQKLPIILQQRRLTLLLRVRLVSTSRSYILKQSFLCRFVLCMSDLLVDTKR